MNSKINNIKKGSIIQMNKALSKKPYNNTGFTIVELLVVIVVIGILAAITIVSYRGITGKANEAAITADLTNASKKLAMYYAQYGTYPEDLNTTTGCPTAPHLDTNYCIKYTTGSSFTYTPTLPSEYKLSFAKNGLAYEVTNTKSPYSITAPATTPITAIGSITGTPQTSQTLTAGATTPAGATVSYQWQSATTAGGTYTNINSATASTYTLAANDFNKYIKVIVTGTGVYTGTQTSTATIAIADPNWIMVGSQKWAKANLNVGTRIAGASNQTNNAITEKYCYSDTDSNCTSGGGLYQWDEAMQYSTTEKAQGICPVGSHIPSDNEWKTLEMSLSGMTQATADGTGWRGTDEGTKLKSGGASGLNVPLAGYRSTDGSFANLSSFVYLWSSSESSTSAWGRYLNTSQAGVVRYADRKANGFSVRCLGN